MQRSSCHKKGILEMQKTWLKNSPGMVKGMVIIVFTFYYFPVVFTYGFPDTIIQVLVILFHGSINLMYKNGCCKNQFSNFVPVGGCLILWQHYTRLA
jgi:hypothetical protein